MFLKIHLRMDGSEASGKCTSVCEEACQGSDPTAAHREHNTSFILWQQHLNTRSRLLRWPAQGSWSVKRFSHQNCWNPSTGLLWGAKSRAQNEGKPGLNKLHAFLRRVENSFLTYMMKFSQQPLRMQAFYRGKGLQALWQYLYYCEISVFEWGKGYIYHLLLEKCLVFCIHMEFCTWASLLGNT